MKTSDKIGIIQGLKTAWMGMGIMLFFPLITNLIKGTLNELFIETFSIENWGYIFYVILLTSFCGCATGRFAGERIINQNRSHITSGMYSSFLSLVFFGFFSMIPFVAEAIYVDRELNSEVFFIIVASTLAITIVGSIPALLVGSYLGSSINNKRIQLKL
jgi:hypothetical protein